MIGLVDYDLQTSSSINLTPPNLEIMKLATYYKLEENKFCRLVDLDESDLSTYDKIYFMSEGSYNPKIPETFLRADNVVFGGAAFTKEYIPFENEIIDYTLPRLAIYQEFLKRKYQDGIKTKVISHILDDSYYRMYAGENKLPIPPINVRKRIFIYDKNIFYPDWQEIITELTNRRPSNIICIHPIICKTVSQFFQVRKFSKISRSNSIILDFDIPLEEVSCMLKKYKNYFLAEITENSNVYLSLGGSFNNEQKYIKDFVYKINLLYSFWSKKIPLKIIYQEPYIGEKDPIQHLSKMVEAWSTNDTKENKTLNERRPRANIKNNPIERQEQEIVIKRFPSASNLFNQTFNNLKNRGYWAL